MKNERTGDRIGCFCTFYSMSEDGEDDEDYHINIRLFIQYRIFLGNTVYMPNKHSDYHDRKSIGIRSWRRGVSSDE